MAAWRAYAEAGGGRKRVAPGDVALPRATVTSRSTPSGYKVVPYDATLDTKTQLYQIGT